MLSVLESKAKIFRVVECIRIMEYKKFNASQFILRDVRVNSLVFFFQILFSMLRLIILYIFKIHKNNILCFSNLFLLP